MAGLADLASLAQAKGIDIGEINNTSEDLRSTLQISSGELDEMTRKWDSYDRNTSEPNYIGRDEQSWLQDNDRIHKLLKRSRAAGKADNYLKGILRNNGFTNDAESNNILYNLDRKPRLHTEDMWVPGAAADEFLSQRLLQYSGFSPVKLENAKGDPMATDLSIMIDGAPRMMDAQSRTTGSSLNLEALLYDGRARQYVLDNYDQPFGESLKRISDMNTGVKEGKYLHTSNPDINPILSHKIVGKPRHEKEFLISSNRKGLQSGTRTPYNRELPNDWDVVDLEKAREMLHSLSPAQMGSKYGIDVKPGRFSQALILDMPESFIKKELNHRSFTPEVNPDYEYAKWFMSRRGNKR